MAMLCLGETKARLLSLQRTQNKAEKLLLRIKTDRIAVSIITKAKSLGF